MRKLDQHALVPDGVGSECPDFGVPLAILLALLAILIVALHHNITIDRKGVEASKSTYR